ncbi:hypothetical protein [Nonomuraea sp. NPDC050310]|uniref:hypothetical protein n=1 Tax=Nonomuraea sp. NPDC050310 TaxID=3154935 RepID=UPI0033DFFE3E
MSTGYSYTTISVRPGDEPRIGVSIYPDARARVEYYTANPEMHPFLSIEYGAAHVSIGATKTAKVTDEHVKFARQLLDAATAFLADCERLRAAA